MRGVWCVLVLICTFVIYCRAAGCHGTATYGPENNFPVINGHSHSKLIKTVPNGKLYEVTVPNSGGNTTATFKLVHIYGSPYQMGYAQGSLLKTEAKEFIDNVWAFIVNQVDNALPTYFPKWLDDLIADVGLDAALDLTEDITAAYTGEWFYGEMHGIADATGVDYQTIVRVHMIAGLTQGHCSMFGAWGSALSPKNPEKVLQLRALDWNMQGPFVDYSQITVYHPSEGNGHAFANVGFTGFIGGLTGMSSTKLGISEIGVVYPDKTFGEESRIGVPFIFLLRNILQFDYTIDDAISRMINAPRTCDLILGVGDGKLGQFRGFEYSYSTLKVFDDLNMQPYNETWHPRLKDTTYWGMDWICPSYNEVLGTLLKKYHGAITPELSIQSISAVEQSGDNHIAFYDLTDLELYVSFAAPHNVGGPVAGYARQYTKWDCSALFAEKQ